MDSLTPVQVVPSRNFSPPQVGEKITCGGVTYCIGQQIGQGSFGAVFECRDEWGNDLVAKVLLPQNRSYEVVKEEWLHEFNNLQQLRHPNITFIHQAFEYRDTFYLIVEKCSRPLTNLIQLPNLEPDIWIPHVARDILHGLDFIHQNGIVHKDLHPGNVFVSHSRDRMIPTQEPVWAFKIGDLGISRLEGHIRLYNTVMAQWMLPPEYLSPAEFGALGKHVDIYHTGLLLLGLSLRQIPTFSREEILGGVPRLMAEKLTTPYAPAIARSLRRHVNDRTQSALEMWREIAAIKSRILGAHAAA